MSWRHYDDYEDEDGYYDDEFEEIDEEVCMEDYTRPPEAIHIDGPVQAVNRRGEFGTTWWGKEWLTALNRVGLDGRLERGRRYARNGSVLFMDINHGLTFGRVQGTYKYCARVILKKFSDKEWIKALTALSDQAIYAAKLLAGEMPADIEKVFQQAGSSLFPRDRKDISFKCSCPDGGNPCKHAAAIYYLLAEQLDADPFMLFHLRGRSREQVLSTLRTRRSGGQDTSSAALDADLSTFWTGTAVNIIHTAPVIPDQPPLLLQLGDPPGGITDSLRAIYKSVSTAVHEQLSTDADQG